MLILIAIPEKKMFCFVYCSAKLEFQRNRVNLHLGYKLQNTKQYTRFNFT